MPPSVIEPPGEALPRTGGGVCGDGVSEGSELADDVASILAKTPSAGPQMSLQQYHAAIDAEILGPDDKLELLNAYLIPMPAHSPEHAEAVEMIVEPFFILSATVSDGLSTTFFPRDRTSH